MCEFNIIKNSYRSILRAHVLWETTVVCEHQKMYKRLKVDSSPFIVYFVLSDQH